MSKHTPGPWYVLSDRMISNTIGPHWARKDCFIVQAHSDANAALIAAAPEMLEALAGLVAAAEKVGFYSPALAVAQTVIAKAEGK